MIAPPVRSSAELEAQRRAAIGFFREERMREPLEQYLEAFETYRRIWKRLLTISADLLRFRESAFEILTDRTLLEAVRYLPGPIISEDDLKTLAEAVLSPARLRGDPAMVERIVNTILQGLDQRRFPWFPESRSPTPAERRAAILASSVLMANSRVGTRRRNEGRLSQERAVEETLLAQGLRLAPRRSVSLLTQAPAPGEVCRESQLGSSKADFLLTLWDGRLMPIECKVSNSAVNSVKRLNREAAGKAEQWTRYFGKAQIVPAAVLSGVYDLRNLEDAQERGLALFWAHDLDELARWIAGTRSGPATPAFGTPAPRARRRGADRRRR
jgi:hypothetical protein